jgi:hypothetical protein
MAFTFDGKISSIAYLASVFTLVKMVLLGVCVLVLLIGAVISLRG